MNCSNLKNLELEFYKTFQADILGTTLQGLRREGEATRRKRRRGRSSRQRGMVDSVWFAPKTIPDMGVVRIDERC